MIKRAISSQMFLATYISCYIVKRPCNPPSHLYSVRHTYALAIWLPPATAAPDPCANFFLLTNLIPPTVMNNAAAPRITASVTIAPITPLTAGLRPWCALEVVPEPELELDVEEFDVGA